MGATVVIGRERELEAVRALVEAGAGALVLEGEAGIGKTTVWTAGLEDAQARGFRVLVARPAEAETALPYATVSDLLEPVLDDAVRSMPLPQRRALDVALGRSAPGAVSHTRFVAAALLTALRTLAADVPLLVAIDDMQWVDAASTEPLTYALRRVASDSTTVLATRRADMPGGVALAGAARVRIDALDADEIARLVRGRLGLELHRSVLRRIAARSGGNPFFALELARDGRLAADPDAPLPPSLDALLRDRIGAAPPDVRDTLLLVALHPKPTPEVLARAGAAPDAVDRAIDLDLLAPAGEQVRLTHPLLASAVRARTTATLQRRAHRRLAEAVRDPDEQALHLALATRDPDEEVSRQLEAAAERAMRRDTRTEAAELARHAVRLTPGDQSGAARRRRLLYAELVGEIESDSVACSLVRREVDEAPAGPDRARALFALARHTYEPAERVRICEEALAEADESLRPRLLLSLANGFAQCGQLDDMVRALEEAVPLAEATGDQETLALALIHRAWQQWCAGEGIAEQLFLRADDLLTRSETRPTTTIDAKLELAEVLSAAAEYERAKELFEQQLAFARERGDDWKRTKILAELGGVEARLGNPHAAEALVQEAVELARQLQDREFLGIAVYWRSRVRALLGQLDGAQSDAEEVLATSQEMELWRVCAVDVLGYLALSRGDLDVAADLLEQVIDRLHAYPWREPSLVDAHHHLAEVYALRNELERAEAVVDELEAIARPIGRTRSLAGALRVRGLIAAARGDIDGACTLLYQALEVQAARAEPHESGRTLLHLGMILRRTGKKRAAREALAEAARTLESAGSQAWAERAGAELERISGRRMRTGSLTPTERQIARLVAAGESNHAVARALSLSPKTVEWNLTKIYRKLGVRSRTELAAKVAKRKTI